jgi:fructose-1,6-bisphosphatase/inositol monophosphatase family enzyme
VSEAGGKVSNFTNGAFELRGVEILATNKTLHSAILKSI